VGIREFQEQTGRVVILASVVCLLVVTLVHLEQVDTVVPVDIVVFQAPTVKVDIVVSVVHPQVDILVYLAQTVPPVQVGIVVSVELELLDTVVLVGQVDIQE
jgi:hypothetical protein